MYDLINSTKYQWLLAEKNSFTIIVRFFNMIDYTFRSSEGLRIKIIY